MNKIIPAIDYCVNIFDGTHETPKPVDKGFPLVTSKHIMGKKLDLSSPYNISEMDYKNIQKRSQVSQWDILFSMIGSVGEVYIEKTKTVPYAIKNIGVFSCKDELKAKWLYYYLQSPSAKLYINRYLSGAVQKFLSLGGLRDFPVITFHDQSEKIVAVLSSLDAKIELNNRINEELEAMAKTLYDYWFVQFDFPDKNGKPYKSSGGKMVWNEELKREIPEGWEINTLSILGDIVGGSTPDTKEDSYFAIDAFPWITPKDISIHSKRKFISRGEIGVTSSGIKNASLKKISKGSVLLTSRAPVGYTAIALNEVTTNQGFKSFVPKNEYSTSYIYYTINLIMSTIILNASGSTFKEIPSNTLKNIKFYFAPKNLIEGFSSKIDPIFSKQINIELENEQLSKLRDFLLPMLMNGQVKVQCH